MKNAATHLLKGHSKNRAFSKLSNFYFDLRLPALADPRERQVSESSTPGATRMCESPGGGWSGLTDT